MPKKWTQGQCQCTNDMGGCLYAWCCPCFAYKEVAENTGDDMGLLYCLVTFPLGCGCCVLTVLGDKVAQQRGIDSGLCKSGCKAFFDPLCCYSCSLLHESRIMREEYAKGGAVKALEMERGGSNSGGKRMY